MKRTSGLAFALFCGAMVVGCGGGSETTGSMPNPMSQGGMSGGVNGGAAVGATWAPIPTAGAGGGGLAGIGNPPAGMGGVSGMVAGASGMGSGGMVAAGSGGAGPTGGVSGMEASGGMGGPAGMGGTGGTPSVGSKSPTIPPVTADCPDFRDGTITFMGLGGIQVVAGAKPAGPTAPMVFYWHGTLSTAGEFAGMAADVVAGVRAEGGVLISFQGSTGGDFLSGTSIFGEGDFELADQLAACAVQNHNVDPRRIFATGCSAGGLFSTAMAAMRSSYIAAAAPNSGGLAGFPVAFETDYTPALMTVHGAMGQDVVGIDFATSSANADRTFKARGGFVVNCDHGGGHCGGRPLAGSIWEFFKAHPYGVEPNPWEGGLPGGIHDSCIIYQ